MIDFNELQPIVNDKYSFVGIQKSGSQVQLCLPRGFDTDLFSTYDNKRDIFFLLYKVLGQFQNICISKGYLDYIADRDGVIQDSSSIQQIKLPDINYESNLLYSKLDNIGAIISAYDEPKILSLACRLGINEEIDYSKINRFLHRAIYLNNGVAYIDTMTLPRQQVQYQSTDIVSMYCYILLEIKKQLNEEISSDLQGLAEDFSHRYIGLEYGLFDEGSGIQTVDILKDALVLIERYTPLKDVDYWQFHDAIELFLYGELSQQNEGEVWGIKNFHSVWESICLTYIVKHLHPGYILHLDTKYLADDVINLAKSQPKKLNLSETFKINGTSLRPDAVILVNLFSNNLNVKDTYILKEDVNKHAGDYWNDSGYKTAFYCKLPNSSNKIWLRIAHINQNSTNHTSFELRKYYNYQDNQLVITSRIPSQFYCFWQIKPEELNNEILCLMYQLNHVFFLALKNGIFTLKGFKNFVVNQLYEANYGVFNKSLFRAYTEFNKPNINELANSFGNFAKKISYFRIIDIKYLDSNYFLNTDNQRNIKENSVCKQFVYEYLLQKHIQHNDDLGDLEVKSSFWLPYWREDSSMWENAPEYLNGNISLNNINFVVVSDSYF